MHNAYGDCHICTPPTDVEWDAYFDSLVQAGLAARWVDKVESTILSASVSLPHSAVTDRGE